MIKDKDSKQYDIQVGDYVETIDGLIGYVENPCLLDECEAFLHFKITNVSTEVEYHNLKIPFSKYFKKIGKYDFSGNKIEKIQLQKTKESCTSETGCSYYRNGYKEIPQIVIVNKINEIVSRLNELEK